MGDAMSDAGVTLLELSRTVQLKGMCTPERAAAALSTAQARVENLLEGNAEFFQTTALGVALTARGREWLTEQLASERLGLDAATLAVCYDRFTELNHRFKQLVSEWQLLPDDARTDDAWASLVESVAALHARLRPLIEETAGPIARLRGYGDRFERALAGLQAGETSMLASPLEESYHTVWFEYHEELIALCGRDRAVEEDG
jgi:pyruvate,orthophosphate dikinase